MVRFQYLLLLYLLIHQTKVNAAEHFYLIAAPSRETIAAETIDLMEYIDGKILKLSSMKAGTNLCGMKLLPNRESLLAYGSLISGEGFVEIMSIVPEYAISSSKINIPTNLGLFFGLPLDVSTLYTWKGTDPPNAYDTYKIILSNKSEEIQASKINLNEVPSSFSCYTQSGAFSEQVSVTLNRKSGRILYYKGFQEWPSEFELPRLFITNLSEKIEKYDWVCFSNDEKWFACKAMDKVADKVHIFIYDKKLKKWNIKSVDGYASVIWANENGLAVRNVRTTSKNEKVQGREFRLYSYELNDAGNVSLPGVGEMIGWDSRRTAYRIDDSIFVSYFEQNSKKLNLSLVAKDKDLNRVSCAFWLERP